MRYLSHHTRIVRNRREPFPPRINSTEETNTTWLRIPFSKVLRGARRTDRPACQTCPLDLQWEALIVSTILATSSVQPVWWFAPSPALLSRLRPAVLKTKNSGPVCIPKSTRKSSTAVLKEPYCNEVVQKPWHHQDRNGPQSGLPEAMCQSKYSYYDQIESDHVVQKPWHHQDQNARNQSHQRFVRHVRQVHCTSPFQKSVLSRYLLSLYFEK